MSAETNIQCIKCRTKKHPEFDNGWEEIIDNSECINNPEGSAKIYHMCKGCISEFEYCRQLKEEQAPLIEFYAKVMSIFNGIDGLIKKSQEK